MGNINYCAGCTDEYAVTEEEQENEQLALYKESEAKITKIQAHLRKYKARKDSLSLRTETMSKVHSMFNKAPVEGFDAYEPDWAEFENQKDEGRYIFMEAQKPDENGHTYTGQLLIQEGGVATKNGMGKLVYSNGNIYEGEWVDGVRHGKGRLIQADGCSYSGEWFSDTINGYGTFETPDGY